MATVNGIDPAALNRKLATPGAELSKMEFKQAVTNFKGEMELALPMHLKRNADKYVRQAMSLFSQNPELQKCTGVTILSALMTATGLGLELTPALGQCYIIPYDNRKKVNGSWVSIKEAQWQLGYRGAIALAMRSGEIKNIEARVVYEHDTFEYEFGLEPKLCFKPFEGEDRGTLRYVYAAAKLTNGGFVFDVWPVSQVIAHAKKFSKSYYKRDYKTGQQVENDKSPWHTHFESMAKKTLLLAIWKYLPISTEAMLAGVNDETIKRNINYSEVESEKDVITITPAFADDDEGYNDIPPEYAENMPIPESEAPEEGAADVLSVLRKQVERNMGADGLDYTEAERAEFYFSKVKRKDTASMSEAELRKILAESAALIKSKDKE